MKTAVFGEIDYDSLQKTLQWHDITSIITTETEPTRLRLEKYCAENNMHIKVVSANWHTDGKSAGVNRTKKIIAMSDQIVIFGEKKTSEVNWAIKLSKNTNKFLYEY